MAYPSRWTNYGLRFSCQPPWAAVDADAVPDPHARPVLLRTDFTSGCAKGTTSPTDCRRVPPKFWYRTCRNDRGRGAWADVKVPSVFKETTTAIMELTPETQASNPSRACARN